jgi:uncharacterized membrane protein YcaP (DUF421 family)
VPERGYHARSAVGFDDDNPPGAATMETMTWLFGGDVPEARLELHQIAARAAVVYLAGILVVRCGKGRLIGRATALDILLGFILGSLLSRGITGHASLSGTAIATSTLVALHWLFTWAGCKWHGFGDLVKGHAIQLVDHGTLIPENMRTSHISDHDLLEACRLHGIEGTREILVAFKERNGDISIVKRKD